MNKEDKPLYEPTFEGTFKDLNTAHEEGGDTQVDELYDPHQAALDNAATYTKEMTQADTPEKLSSLKTRLQPDEEHNDQIEVERRTEGNKNTRESLEKRINKREEKFKLQDKKAENYKNFIQNSKSTKDLNDWLNLAVSSHELGKITLSQLNEIKNVAEDKLAQLQNETTENYKNFIQNSKSTKDLNDWLNLAVSSHELGKITLSQLNEIKNVAEDKLAQLQNETTEKYKNFIQNSKSTKDLNDWLNLVVNAHKLDKIRLSQLNEIKNVAEDRKIEIAEGI